MIHETNLAWENHYINLSDRKVRIDADTWQIGNDGEKVWISPNRQAFQGNSVRFYHNLYFYFFSRSPTSSQILESRSKKQKTSW
ncbi:hypothetical protein [Algoriphagus boritolerans]|uniref:hypothetical protein n=1 Tax=Algoriphagus boritolerans TaxID=308111 RepID=UPI000A7EB2AA